MKYNEATAGFVVELSGLPAHHHTLTPSGCEPFREAIGVSLRRGSNAMAIWQDLVADSGFSSSYETIKRFVRKLRRTPPQTRAVIVTAPGEEAQVD